MPSGPLCVLGHDAYGWARRGKIKVFWFFSSEKSKDSSFSEEKEAKRLLFLRAAAAASLTWRHVVDFLIAFGLWEDMRWDADCHDVIFRSLGDPTRRAIFEQLCREGEQTVGALTVCAGISQPAVSKHLGVLRKAGLVVGRPDGRQTQYRAQVSALAPLLHWTSRMGGFWQSRFDDLENLLKRMDQ